MNPFDPLASISRREALRLLGLTGAVAATAGRGAASATFAQSASRSTPPIRRDGPIIRTVLRDYAPEELGSGPVLMHEHLSIHYPIGATEHFTDDVALMTEEARLAVADGVACIVDGGHPDMARDLDALRRIATGSGMPIVAGGGYYMQRTYPTDIASKSAERIATELVAEIDRDHIGAIGEIGQQDGVLTADEQKVFEAIGMAQAITGLPVFTHNAYTGTRAGTVPREAGLRQLDILLAAGARPTSIAIGHMCCLDDPKAEVAMEIAATGAFVAFDRVTLNAIIPDTARVTMALALIDAGHANKLLLSSDFYSANSLKTRGGSGLAQTVTVFAPMLRAEGVPEETMRQILVENPRRFLAFTPRA
jgi:phosphotriesterase-related protein